MRKSIVGATCACLSVASFNMNAATMVVDASNRLTGINGLSILGSYYNAVFVDANYQTTYSESSPPYFMNNEFGAVLAAESILDAIVADGTFVSNPRQIIGCADTFRTIRCYMQIPYQLDLSDNSQVSTWTTRISARDADSVWRTHTTFTSDPRNANYVVFSAVPVPAAVWLFGSGLIGLISVARIKKTSLYKI